MDATDLKILRLMGLQPFIEWPRDIDHLKPSFFARALGTTPETAKARVRRLEEEGVISGYEIYPNWAQLGLFAASYIFRCPDVAAKQQALRDVEAVEGVITVENFLGPEIGFDVLFRTPGELERRTQILSKLLGGAKAIAHIPRAALPIGEQMTILDWRIVRALRHRANRPLPEVADELRVSAKTVRRRLDRMWEQGSIDTIARLNVGRITHHILSNFIVGFEKEQDPKAAGQIFRAFDTSWAYCWTPPDRSLGNLVIGMVFRSPVEVADAARRIGEIPGVRVVEPLVSVSYATNEAPLDDAIDLKIGETSSPSSKSAS